MKRSPAWMLTVAQLCLLFVACSSESPGDAICNGYLDEEIHTPVEIVIRNDGSDPIFLGGQGCSSQIEIRVSDADGNPIDHEQRCNSTCEVLQSELSVECPAICAAPPVVMVNPGGSYRTSWGALAYQAVTMPDGCFEGDATAECMQYSTIPTANYEVTLVAWPDGGCGGDPCTCTPDADGSCTLDGFGSVQGDERTATTTLDYPTDKTIEVVFN